MSYKLDNKKEFICRQCSIYLDQSELVNGKCPHCNSDEDVFINEDEDEDII